MATVNSHHHKLKSGFCRYYGIPALRRYTVTELAIVTVMCEVVL